VWAGGGGALVWALSDVRTVCALEYSFYFERISGLEEDDGGYAT